MPNTATRDLGTINGLCACYSKATLNGRPYDKIYKKILAGEDERFNMMMERGGILCEFGHPAQISADFERTETDPEKACAIITNIEEGEDGKIYATGKILDTPSGRVYKAIAPFYKFGFSSRGSYEMDEASTEGPDGWNQDSYVFKGFDIVALPANEGSEISITEGLSSLKKKKIKSARESLDLNEIASAANVDPDEINKELDKLFNDDGEIEGSELISLKDYDKKDNGNTKPNEEKTPEVNSETEEPIQNSPSDIKKDLETAIAEAARLRQELETSEYNLKNANFELDRLKTENQTLTTQLEEAQSSLSNLEEIKMLSAKLADSYKGVKSQHRSEIKTLRKEADKNLEQANEYRQEYLEASESLKNELAKSESTSKQLSSLKAKCSSYAKELLMAKEQVIDMYANIYGVDESKLKQKLGKDYRVPQIKAAAEELINTSLRLSSVSVKSVAPRVISCKSVKEQFTINDDIDRELIEALTEND